MVSSILAAIHRHAVAAKCNCDSDAAPASPCRQSAITHTCLVSHFTIYDECLQALCGSFFPRILQSIEFLKHVLHGRYLSVLASRLILKSEIYVRMPRIVTWQALISQPLHVAYLWTQPFSLGAGRSNR